MLQKRLLIHIVKVFESGLILKKDLFLPGNNYIDDYMAQNYCIGNLIRATKMNTSNNRFNRTTGTGRSAG